MPQSYPIISIPTTCVQILNKKVVETWTCCGSGLSVADVPPQKKRTARGGSLGVVCGATAYRQRNT